MATVIGGANTLFGFRPFFHVGQCVRWFNSSRVTCATDNLSGWSNAIAAAASCCRSQTLRNNLTKAQIRTRFQLGLSLGMITSHLRAPGVQSKRRISSALPIAKLGSSVSERCLGTAAICLNVAGKCDLNGASLKAMGKCVIRSGTVSVRT
jgi:hypothetical protein